MWEIQDRKRLELREMRGIALLSVGNRNAGIFFKTHPATLRSFSRCEHANADITIDAMSWTDNSVRLDETLELLEEMSMVTLPQTGDFTELL